MKIKTLGKQKTASHRPLPAPRPAQTPKRESKAKAPIDPAELKQLLDKAKGLPDIRWDKVHAMREAILADGYDTEERLAQLADRLPTELFEA